MTIEENLELLIETEDGPPMKRAIYESIFEQNNETEESLHITREKHSDSLNKKNRIEEISNNLEETTEQFDKALTGYPLKTFSDFLQLCHLTILEEKKFIIK